VYSTGGIEGNGSWLFPSMRARCSRQMCGKLIEDQRPKCWSDDLTWLPNHEELLPAFSEKLWSYYTHAKAFHGCRPENLAAHIVTGDPWGEDYRIRLRNVRVPTILEIDIPVALIPSSERLAGARLILSHWGQRRARKLLGSSSSPGYRLRTDLPPECIKAHYHPARIVDRHTTYGRYENGQLICELCEPV